MNRDEIIRMAQEAGLAFDSEEFPEIWQTYMNVGREEIERFAALVASAEANACIVDIQWHIPRSGRDTPEYQMAMRMIERIRARKSGYE